MLSFITEPSWKPEGARASLRTLDMHTCGEPLRIVIDGLPPLPQGSVLEKRRYFREHYDELRTHLLWEPRGHADMYGAIVTRACDDADFDVFFLHNEGYSTMCGHAIIALTRLFAETRGTTQQGEVSLAINVPAGRVSARATLAGGLATGIRFRNVPSFVSLREACAEVQGLGQVRFDVAYGGAFYAIVEAAPLGLALEAREHSRLVEYGSRIKRAVAREVEIRHPFEDDLGFLYGVIFTGPAAEARHHSRNVCVFAEGEVDRSPTGSGVSARAALHLARGELAIGQTIHIESILGTTMSVMAAEHTRFGPHEAVIPEVGGHAFYTGRQELYLEEADPLRAGFILR